VGRFTQDRKRIIGLEGNGHVDIVTASNPAQGEDLGGRKQITCERFYTELAPDGQINAFNAIGEPGMAHAVFDGPPKRDMVAKNFRIALANRAVSEVKADSNVVMKELGPAPREIKGDRMTVSFDVATHKASSAFIDGSFKYTDPKNTASAFRANYDIPADRVLLTAEPGFDPTVVSEGQTVKAKQIEFSPRGGTAKATGSVIAQLISKQNGPAADGTNLFPAGKPVFVNADVLNLRQANKTAVFSGNVRAWQETNTVFAQELQVQGMGELITARGNVRTLLYNSGGTETRKTPVTTNSDQLLARRNERRIDLLGSVKIVDETRTVTAEKAVMFLDANKKLERMEAEKNVVIVDASTGRRATGDKAVYILKTKIVLLDGNPATATAPNGNLSGQQVKLDLVRNKVEIVSPTQGTQGSYKPQP
ncbi:MAG TPA: LptA/OstA family protein, partial [Thermoanaerobaculia bacterium]|nr:LptA/OstA family protein [Thermoanaerobaculia bacterium]